MSLLVGTNPRLVNPRHHAPPVTAPARFPSEDDKTVTHASWVRHGDMLHCAESGVFPARTTLKTNMKIKSIICSVVTLGLLAGGLTACTTEKEGKEGKESEKATAAQLEAQAKITKAEAQKIALDKVPGGTIKEGEIEKEKGKVIWSFDIATPGTKDITEVNVDAMTGAIVDVSKETVADQAKEKKEDAKAKAKKDDDDDKEEKK
jgi:uncharacterized membrane protein YkoI